MKNDYPGIVDVSSLPKQNHITERRQAYELLGWMTYLQSSYQPGSFVERLLACLIATVIQNIDEIEERNE